MNLLDIIDGKAEADTTAQTSERIRILMHEGLGLFERSLGLKFMEILIKRRGSAEMGREEAALLDHVPGETSDEFLNQPHGGESGASEGEAAVHDATEYDVDKGGDEAPPCGRLESGEDAAPEITFEYLLSLVDISTVDEAMEKMSELEKSEVSDFFELRSGEMAKVLPHLWEIQSACSHDQDQSGISEPAFCLKKFAGPSEVAITVNGETGFLNLDESLFGTMTLLRHMLSDVPIKGICHLAREWRAKVAVQLNGMPQTVLAEMDFPDNWTDHRIWQESKAKPIEGGNDADSYIHGHVCGYNYKAMMRIYNELGDDRQAEVSKRTQVIREKLAERGWDTEDSRMDSCEWTARVCVLKSVVGIEDEDHGFLTHEFHLAKALANGSEDRDDLSNALNDYYAEKTVSDSVWISIPKGTSNEAILEKIDRWMKCDLKRCESNFDDSSFFISNLERHGGSVISIKNISPFFMPSLLDRIFDEINDRGSGNENLLHLLGNPEADHSEITRDLKSLEDSEKNSDRMFDVCRHALMTRIGESGIMRVTYRVDLDPWPQEIVVDLDKANPAFKAEIEDEYKLRDPEKVGCRPYCAPFHYPFALENDLEKMLLKKLPTENPFGSVDGALFFSHRYYVNVLKKKFYKNIVFSRPGQFGFILNCTELTAQGPGKFKATFQLIFEVEDIFHFECDFVVPIEVEEVNGEFRLNIKKMQLRCSRDVESAAKKIARKIRKMNI